MKGRMAGYNRDRFRQDVMAGIIVGIVAIPLAMAFAIASGVSPDRGLYTAIIAGAAISIFGGSRVQIGGPTGAMVAILSVIVLQYGLDNLLLAGFVAGLLMFCFSTFGQAPQLIVAVKLGARRPEGDVDDGHVVDLDGAFAGKPMNGAAVDRILETVGLCVQLGGGIRDMKTIDGWLSKGVDRVIIGTAAVRDPALVKEAAKKFPNRVAVGLDAKDGKVAVEGWAETSELTVLDIAKRFEDAGVAAIIYTDVARDGMLKGINWDATIGLADAISIPVIASGGLASIDDIKVMTEPRAKKLEGAIAGRALYDGRLDAREALAMLNAARGG